MIDLKDLRANPDRYKTGATAKGTAVDIDALLGVDGQLREASVEREQLAAEKNRIGKQIGQLAGLLKKAQGPEKEELQTRMTALQQRPNQIKQREQQLQKLIDELEPKRDDLWLSVPQPPDEDVPRGAGSRDNVAVRCWNPPGFDASRTFAENRGFEPKSHVELGHDLGLFDFKRGVKIAGSRSYVLVGDGMRLHQAILRLGLDFIVHENGFTPMSVPVLVRDAMMVGTGFFPHGRDQTYAIGGVDPDAPDDADGSAAAGLRAPDRYLTGTGEVGLMGFHEGEILEAESLPRCYTTVSTCFRREAGAAGKDTAGLFRIHQFDKVEQVVICRADEAESRRWHKKMIDFVEQLLRRLELPYRLLQCCTGDLGPKNADQIDIECWMPGRGDPGPDGRPGGAYAETHSASRLYDFQCRRLNIRYRDPDSGNMRFCHALNSTVVASPRILIPILEIHQNADGSVIVPAALRPYMAGTERLEGA